MLLGSAPAGAYNTKTHQNVVEMSYGLMRAANAPGPEKVTPDNPPPGYAEFESAMGEAVEFWRDQASGLPPHAATCTSDGDRKQVTAASSQCLQAVGIAIDGGWIKDPGDCPIVSDWAPGGFLNDLDPLHPPPTPHTDGDHTGNILGFWSRGPDQNIDDAHLWFRATNALGLGTMLGAGKVGFEAGVTSILVPIYCAAQVICDALSFFDLCSPSKDCFEQAQHDSSSVDVIDDAAGLIPGVDDLTDKDFEGLTGAWHHVSMNPGNSNTYDDRQGLFFEEAGPFPSAIDLAVLIGGDIAGLSIYYDKSDGPKHYQITAGGDFHPNTIYRDKAAWEAVTLMHLPFEPVDNLGWYGWAKWKATGDTAFIGYPLHALADAAAPHHIVGAVGHGHRPFEDATDQRWLWLRHVLLPDEDQTPTSLQELIRFGSPQHATQVVQARRILARAFDYRTLILNWRQTHGIAADVPVRDLVTAVAQTSYAYATDRFSTFNTTPWPFNDAASLLYLDDQGAARDQYLYFESQDAELDNDALTRPLLEEAIAATIAFLTSAAERPPDQSRPCSLTPAPTGCVPGVFCAPTPTPAPQQAGLASGAEDAIGDRASACVGDCDDNGLVSINDLIAMVGIALGEAATSRCPAGDANGDGQVSIAEIVQAVNNALDGCNAPPHTPTPTPASPGDCAERVRAAVRLENLPPLEANLAYRQRLLQQCLADPEATPSDAEASFKGSCLGIDYVRFAEMFLAEQLDASAYLGLVRDRSAKGRMAEREIGYVEAFAAGDEDGDCVPDSLDQCAHTPPDTVTDEDGCPDSSRARPTAATDEDVRRAIDRLQVPLDARCLNPGHPGIPKPIKFGYNNVNRNTLKVAIVPVSRDPAACPIYYELNFSFHKAAGVPAHAGFIVADSTNIEPGGPRAVFVLDGTDVGQRKALFDEWKYEAGGGFWRVRAINGAGIAGPWSDIALNPAVSFGEP